MDTDGLIIEVGKAVQRIYEGRIWLDTEGLEAKGRLRYHEGLAMAMDALDKTIPIAADDLGLPILLELGYLVQELHSCDPGDAESVASIERGMSELEDALRALSALNQGAAYRIVDLAYPRKGDRHRKDGLPKDAYHVACDSHCTRLGNILKSPGVNLTEKALLRRRIDSLRAAKAAYMDRQRAALGEDGGDGG
jgi:hypothetical protein